MEPQYAGGRSRDPNVHHQLPLLYITLSVQILALVASVPQWHDMHELNFRKTVSPPKYKLYGVHGYLTPYEILSLIKKMKIAAFLLENVLVCCLNVVTEPHLSDFSLEGEGEY